MMQHLIFYFGGDILSCFIPLNLQKWVVALEFSSFSPLLSLHVSCQDILSDVLLIFVRSYRHAVMHAVGQYDRLQDVGTISISID